MTGSSTVLLGLRGRFVALVVAVLVVSLGVSAAFSVVGSQRALLELERARSSAVVRQLAESLQVGVLSKSPRTIEPQLDAFSRLPDLVRVTVIDDAGTVLGRRDGSSKDLSTIRMEVPIRWISRVDAQEAADFAALGGPVAGDASPTIGTVIAEFSNAMTREIQADIRRQLLWAFGVASILGAGFVFWLASSMVARIRVLREAAARVSRGDFDVEVATQGNDELSMLAEHFNHMARSLVVQRRSLDDAALQLAERETLSAMGRAMAVIAHEIRNPLGIVLGAAGIVAHPDRPSTVKMDAARTIEVEVRRLDAILKQVLSFARPSPPTPSIIDLLPAITDTVERVRRSGGPAEKLHVTTSGTTVRVRVDEEHFRQILFNLVKNAAEAGASNIDVEIKTEAKRARVILGDNGHGVSASAKSELFRPFFTTKQRGTGLGLFACRRMAKDNGGELRLLDSTEGGGARFELELVREEDGS